MPAISRSREPAATAPGRTSDLRPAGRRPAPRRLGGPGRALALRRSVRRAAGRRAHGRGRRPVAPGADRGHRRGAVVLAAPGDLPARQRAAPEHRHRGARPRQPGPRRRAHGPRVRRGDGLARHRRRRHRHRGPRREGAAARIPRVDGLLVQGRAPRRHRRARGPLARRPAHRRAAGRGRPHAARRTATAWQPARSSCGGCPGPAPSPPTCWCRARSGTPGGRGSPRPAPGRWASWGFEALRVEAARARLGVDTDDRTIPHEVGWVHVAAHVAKGCYRGQETVSKVHNVGRPPRRMLLLHLDGSPRGAAGDG